MSKNKNLHLAKKAKNDEFYTIYEDIEKELVNYKEHFRNKIIYCNCDTEQSNFVQYFKNNFDNLKIKDLIYTSDDFRTHDDLLKQADVVCTNPPFSLFREFIKLLTKFNKKILILGNMNAICYREVFPLIKENKLWLGYTFNKAMFFQVPDYYEGKIIIKDNKRLIKVQNVTWFTNLKNNVNEILQLTCKYDPQKYPKYDNYDAINVDKTKEIPFDYDGVMGVPLSALNKIIWNNFQIIGEMSSTKIDENNFGYPYINKKKKYARILIKKK